MLMITAKARIALVPTILLLALDSGFGLSVVIQAKPSKAYFCRQPAPPRSSSACSFSVIARDEGAQLATLPAPAVTSPAAQTRQQRGERIAGVNLE